MWNQMADSLFWNYKGLPAKVKTCLNFEHFNMVLKQFIFFLWYLIIFLVPRYASLTDSNRAHEEKEVEEFFKEFQEKYDKHYTCDDEYQDRFKVYFC